MALEKEARTNTAGADLDKRNRNWQKIDTHLADYIQHKEGISSQKTLWEGATAATEILFTDNPFNYLYLSIITSDVSNSISNRAIVIVQPYGAVAYIRTMYGAQDAYIRYTSTETGATIAGMSSNLRIIRVIGVGKII